MNTAETRQALSDELEDIALQLSDFGSLPDDSGSADCALRAEQITNEYQRLQMACDLLESDELNPLNSWLQENLSDANQQPEVFLKLHNRGRFHNWAELLAALLREPDALLVDDLVNELISEDWPKPIPAKTFEDLLAAALPDPTQDTQQKQASITAAEQVDVSDPDQTLHWDVNIHPEILEAFLSDTPDQITQSSALIRKIAVDEASADDKQLAARLTHTIKGASAVVGMTSLSTLSHKLENILELSVDSPLGGDAAGLLVESADCLEEVGERMVQQKPLPDNFDSVLLRLEETSKSLGAADDRLLGAVNDEPLDTTVESPGTPDDPLSADDGGVSGNATTADSTHHISDSAEASFQTDASATASTTPIAQATDGKSDSTPGISQQAAILASQILVSPDTPAAPRSLRTAAPEDTIRVPVSLIDELMSLAEELVTSTSQLDDRVKHLLSLGQQQRQQEDRVRSNLDELEYSLGQQFRQLGGRSHDGGANSSSDNDDQFDQLELEVYNEMHSVHSLLAEAIEDNREIERDVQSNLRELNDQLHSQQRINRELNNAILDTRMESLETLTPRLERIVRETCRSTGKQASFSVSGEDLAVDTDILKGITDPLLHMLRNAVDHGIETAEQRSQLGKAKDGAISLSFRQDGHNILMELSDDGQGIDAERIYQRAVTKELIAADDSMSLSDKQKLITLPGLSTRDEVSATSGRGVGMDVVQDAVTKLRGSLNIESVPDRWTKISVRLPLTLVAANTLMVKASGNIIAVPADTIDSLHTLQRADISGDINQQRCQIDGQGYPLASMAQVLNWPEADSEEEEVTALLVKQGNQSWALGVESVLQPREVVVKSLAPWLSNMKGVNGACLLSDGAIAPVINLQALLQDFSPETQPARRITDSKGTRSESALIMIVDDSLSNRKALSITAEQLGYQTVTAIDGEEALERIGEEMPDIILSDLEMPRLNGLGFVEAIRANDALRHLPFIMITSRATVKHRQQARQAGVDEYLVKPVDRDTLHNSLEKWLNKSRQSA